MQLNLAEIFKTSLRCFIFKICKARFPVPRLLALQFEIYAEAGEIYDHTCVHRTICGVPRRDSNREPVLRGVDDSSTVTTCRGSGQARHNARNYHA